MKVDIINESNIRDEIFLMAIRYISREYTNFLSENIVRSHKKVKPRKIKFKISVRVNKFQNKRNISYLLQ